MLKLTRWVTTNPFLTFGLLALAIGVFGAEPAGFDYDPDPVRMTLRQIFFIAGFPFILAGALAYGVFPTPTTRLGGAGEYFWMAFVGLLPYLFADWLWRRWKARPPQPRD